MRLASGLAISILLAAASASGQITPSPNQSKPPAPSPAPAPAKPQPTAPAMPAPTAEKIDPAKESAIRHLMGITQTSKMGDNVLSYFSSRIRTIMTQAIGPDHITQFMDTFEKKFAASAPPSAISDAMVPIYARNFSLEDIQGLIQFYESPLGQRVVKIMPQVEDDSQNAALQIGNKATLDILQAMSDQYPELKQLLQAPDAGPAPNPAPAP